MSGTLAILLASAALAVVAASFDPGGEVTVPQGRFRSVLPEGPGDNDIEVAGFRLDRVPVSNADFAAFVAEHPQWRRDRVSNLFADRDYLAHWASAGTPGEAIADQPVTRVSWFAAGAYCEARGRRLPSWYEWEYAAAASEQQRDARDDPGWRQRILAWYARPASTRLPPVGRTPPNVYGVMDLHGVVWEWIADFNSMLVSADNREQGDPDMMRFCGAGALTMEQKENYPTLMRIAMLSSLQGNYTTATLGFRCAGDVDGATE